MNIITIPAPFQERLRKGNKCPKCGKAVMLGVFFEKLTGEVCGFSLECPAPCGYKQSFDKDGKPATIVRTSPPEKILVDDT